MYFSHTPVAFFDLFLGGTVADLDQLIECLPVERANVTNGEVNVEVRLVFREVLMPHAIYHGCSIKNVEDTGNVVLRREGVAEAKRRHTARPGDDLLEGDGKGADPAISHRPPLGSGTAALVEWGADSGATC